MNLTNNIGLKMPEQQDFYNVDDFNYNAAVIDAAVGGIVKSVSNIKIFASSGTFSAKAGTVYKIITIGGGGGGYSAGAMRGEIAFKCYTPEEDMNIPCTVGNGGTSGNSVSNGGSSSFGSILTSVGGKYGLTSKLDTSYSVFGASGQNGFILGPIGIRHDKFYLTQGNGYGGGGYGMYADMNYHFSNGQSGAVIIFW